MANGGESGAIVGAVAQQKVTPILTMAPHLIERMII
jgi:hypothetical protein